MKAQGFDSARAGQQHNPPPSRNAEQIQQHIRQPGAYPPTEVADLARRNTVRPSGVCSVKSGENEGEIEGRCDQDEQPRLAQQRGDLAGKGCLVPFQSPGPAPQSIVNMVSCRKIEPGRTSM